MSPSVGVREGYRRLRTSRLVRGSSLLLAGYAARLGLQAVSFVLLARALGPGEFGVFAASLAAVSFIAPFADLGAYSLVIRDVTARVPTARAVGNSLVLNLLMLPLAILVLAGVKWAVLPDTSWKVVLPIGVAAFIGGRMLTVARGVFVAHGEMGHSSVVETAGGVGQLAAVAALSAVAGGVTEWSLLYTAQSVAVGGGVMLWVMLRWGRPSWSAAEVRERASAGVHFAVATAGQSMYTDLDKTMLARLATLEATGLYSAAHRVVGVLQVPLMAYVGAVYPRLFEAGRNGYPAARALAWRSVPVVAAYGVAMAAGVWVAAPHLSFLLGGEFAGAEAALRVLSLVLVMQSLHYPFADALSAGGMQRVRSAGQIGALLLGFGVNAWAIPAFGWMGAAWTTVATQTALLLFLALYPVRASSAPAVMQIACTGDPA